jgi:hypothetical protein
LKNNPKKDDDYEDLEKNKAFEDDEDDELKENFLY